MYATREVLETLIALGECAEQALERRYFFGRYSEWTDDARSEVADILLFEVINEVTDQPILDALRYLERSAKVAQPAQPALR